MPSPKAQVWHGPVFGAFVVWVLAALTLTVLRVKLPAGWEWVDGVAYVLAAATALLSLARRLPAQNVVSCGLIIAGTSAVVSLLGAKTKLPFGEFTYTDALGPKVLSLVSWPIPFLWVALILSSRGVAKLILRPWRRSRRYGWLLLGLAALLVTLADFTLEPFAVKAKGFWLWHDTSALVAWQGVSWGNFVGWFIVSAFILAFAGPWLVLKRGSSGSSDFYALATWLGLVLLWTAGNALNQLWEAVTFSVITSALIGYLAWLWGRQFSALPHSLPPAAPAPTAAPAAGSAPAAPAAPPAATASPRPSR